MESCEPRFSQYEIMTILDEVSISSAALTLEGYVGMDMLKPDILVETSPEGVAEVKDGLVQGLYLVLGGIKEQGENRYLPAPIIISLPSFDEASGQWLYDVEAMAEPWRDRLITAAACFRRQDNYGGRSSCLESSAFASS